MKYFQADGIFRKSNNILFDIERGQGRSSSTAAIPGRAHYDNYYANSTADNI